MYLHRGHLGWMIVEAVTAACTIHCGMSLSWVRTVRPLHSPTQVIRPTSPCGSRRLPACLCCGHANGTSPVPRCDDDPMATLTP
ncbi:hypothetical protein J3A83DRAFT_1591511 [Scleroderma citrinum]